jgi:hypothetical protein
MITRGKQAILLPRDCDLLVHEHQLVPHDILKTSSSTSTSTTLVNPSASLLGCPGEIRNQIYYYLFSDPTTSDRLKSLQQDGDINPNTALLQTCRQIYTEIQHMARPNFLLVPKHMAAGVKCVDNLTLPMNDQKIIRILQGPTPPDLLRTLVLREYLHNLILYWHSPSGTPSIPMDLRVETIYVQLCICESVPWILNSTSWINAYGYALTQFLESYSTVKLVVTYFCGLEGDFRFNAQTCVDNQTGFPKLVSRALTHVTAPSVAMESWGIPKWEANEVDGAENCWDLTALPNTKTGKRAVKIEFYNSSTLCKKKCVLE